MNYIGIFFLADNKFYIEFRSFNDAVKYIRKILRPSNHVNMKYSLFCVDENEALEIVTDCYCNNLENYTDIYLLDFGYITIEEANERKSWL